MRTPYEAFGFRLDRVDPPANRQTRAGSPGRAVAEAHSGSLVFLPNPLFAIVPILRTQAP